MGTKVQNLPGYYSMMRDLNEESSSCGWPLFYRDKTPINGKCYENYLPSVASDACSVHDKDVVKRMMLEHEAVFKNQVYELHRLYRIQRDLMNDFDRKELHRNQIPAEASFSQVTTEDGRKWHVSGFPVGNSAYAKPSVSGAAGVHSPLGSIQGRGNQACPFPSPDVGVIESTRPSKVRRKTFDLSLPADENVDSDESDEKLSDEKTSDSTFFLADKSCKIGKEDDGGKVCCRDTSRSEKSSIRRNGLADLNEPAQADETYDSPYVRVPSNSVSATECLDLTAGAKQKMQFFGLSREHLLNSSRGTESWARNDGHLENNGNEKRGISSVAEAGYAKSNLQPVLNVFKPEKSLLSSQTMQHTYSKAREPASNYFDGRSKADTWREKTVSERNHEYFVNNHPESVLPLYRPGNIPFAPSYDLSKSWSHSAASWGKASCSLNQKLVSVKTPPCPNASGSIDRNLEEFWHLNTNSKPNPSIPCDAPLRNGSVSKEPSMNMSSISYDYPNHNNDKNFGKGIDLNAILSNGSNNNNLVPQSNVGIMEGDALSWLRAKNARKNEARNTDRSSITAGETSFPQTASLSMKGETGKVTHGVTSVSCCNTLDQRRIELSESSSNKKILGVPIFDMPRSSLKKELSSITSPSVSIPTMSDAKAMESKHKIRMLDINLPCDANDLEFEKEGFTESVVSKTRSPTAEADSRNQIDLNFSMTEDEESYTTLPSSKTNMKAAIDLEAPAVPESEEDLAPEENKLETSLASPQVPKDAVEQPPEELMRNAAEAIVVLSSLSHDQVDPVINNPSENQSVDPLSWFADVVSLCEGNLKSKCDDSRGKDKEDDEELDYFEYMTLKLEETKEEDYMPKPLVPENFKVEETPSTLPTRTRRGPARRGRQKRDFQRDILPGLVSLSRNEVTEDIQTFGGIMKATGHSWQSGLTRRTSSRKRGRPRRQVQVTPSPSPSPSPPPVTTNDTSTPLMQELNNIEVALEERSLTGWGKTTRRPRRQRCPPTGNHALIPIA
ncbi:uncharacterized protein LOC127119619 [Lathyrus oleraceus]|uniref:Uncharacterized protein n=1 Tax=Pisum sativum TaxID=3888 RepID=A0A9D4YDS0_PEA|nr:uncharacterized protein LOC127119619 [Pisum sativum]XP_050905843.1 uncharacterized protein LOC127119619 [Pisum sativum]KAI5437741.1 hypothetical protein KIW84_023743 [Pisum sativum]